MSEEYLQEKVKIEGAGLNLPEFVVELNSDFVEADFKHRSCRVTRSDSSGIGGCFQPVQRRCSGGAAAVLHLWSCRVKLLSRSPN